VAKIPELADVMVHVDHHWDHLKLIQRSGWKTPADHPDLDPPHEALQLEEHLREAARLQASIAHPPDFQKLMTSSERAVAALRRVLQSQPLSAAGADAALTRAGNSCTACHKAYRD
jgi:hypothetical protein